MSAGTEVTDVGPRTPASRPGRPGGGIGYLPGLDGLRALSVLGVVAYHLEASWATGGYLGVEVFFVVSGFLITSLLLAERAETGTVDLVAFWRRRARRLLPAVAVLVVATCAWGLLVLPAGELARFRGDAIASLLYVQNWHAVVADQPYFAAFGRPSPLRHLWSLAIEEQFYLLWPLLLPAGLRRLGRRGTAAAVAVAVVASVALMAATADVAAPERAYYGTDTRAFGILAGALLAFWWRPDRARTTVAPAARHVLTGGGALALGLLVHQLATRSEYDPWTFPWGFAWVDALTLVALVGVTHPATPLSRWVGAGPLQAVGRRSYSIYLWHWPVIVCTRPGQDWGLDGPTALVARLLLVAALSEASYRLVERPVRDGRLQAALARRVPDGARRRRGVGTVVGATAGVLVAALVAAPTGSAALAAGVPGLPGGATALTIAPGGPSADGSAGAATLPAGPPTLGPVPGRPAGGGTGEDGIGRAPLPTTTTTPAPTTSAPAPEGAAAPSTSTTTAPPAGPTPAPARTEVPDITVIGESVTLGGAPELQAHWGDRVQIDAAEGRSFEDSVRVVEWLASVDRLTSTVILHIGNNGIAPAGALDRVVAAVGYDRRLVLVSVKVPRRWEGQVNGEILRFVDHYDHVVLADWNTLASVEDGLLHDDGVHLSPQGRLRYRDLLAGAAS